MSNTYFVRIDGTIDGPFGANELKALAVEGRLKKNDEVSRDQQHWILASEVKGLEFPTAIDFDREDTVDTFGLPPFTPTLPPVRPATAPSIAQSALRPCPDCGKDVSPRALVCPSCGCPIQLPNTPQPIVEFPRLRTMAKIYFAIGVFLLLCAGLFLLWMVALLDQGDTGAVSAFLGMLNCLSGAGMAIAICEAIRLGLRIEENTRGVDIAIRHRT